MHQMAAGIYRSSRQNLVDFGTPKIVVDPVIAC